MQVESCKAGKRNSRYNFKVVQPITTGFARHVPPKAYPNSNSYQNADFSQKDIVKGLIVLFQPNGQLNHFWVLQTYLKGI